MAWQAKLKLVVLDQNGEQVLIRESLFGEDYKDVVKQSNAFLSSTKMAIVEYSVVFVSRVN